MDYPFELTDQMGNVHTFTEAPTRIISLVPSQTELLCSLGLSSNIVGVTKFCVHPQHIRKSAKVIGGTKKVSFEHIDELEPDLVICNKEENTLEMVNSLQGLCNVWVTDIETIEDNNQMISDLGKIFNIEYEAQLLVDDIISTAKDFEEFIKTKPIIKVAYLIWQNPIMVAASGTFIDEMLKLNNCENVFDNQERYPEISIEQLKSSGAEIIFLSSEPFPFTQKHINHFSELLPDIKIILVDGEYFSWYGSRLVKAFGYFKTLRATFK